MMLTMAVKMMVMAVVMVMAVITMTMAVVMMTVAVVMTTVAMLLMVVVVMVTVGSRGVGCRSPVGGQDMVQPARDIVCCPLEPPGGGGLRSPCVGRKTLVGEAVWGKRHGRWLLVDQKRW